ncbi:hypothetical protein CBOM_06929 [Ceraceosorus bombacis]|uniref:Uncharacterized protein n=1 Tax=Ceraceosorus bombacis TaxID=401625 RepID=A0A0P1BL07_9BASI|nr:hypothetical protein CBOM_06929 [Ceraceosorus bombacis]
MSFAAKPSHAKKRRIDRMTVDEAVKGTLTLRLTQISATEPDPNKCIPLMEALPEAKAKGQKKKLQQGKTPKTQRRRREYTPIVGEGKKAYMMNLGYIMRDETLQRGWRTKDTRQQGVTNRTNVLRMLTFVRKYSDRWVSRFTHGRRYNTDKYVKTSFSGSGKRWEQVIAALPVAKWTTSAVSLQVGVSINGEMSSNLLLPSGLVDETVSFVWLSAVGDACLVTLTDYNVHVEVLPGEVVFLCQDVKFSTRRHPNEDYNYGRDFVLVVGLPDGFTDSTVESTKDPTLTKVLVVGLPDGFTDSTVESTKDPKLPDEGANAKAEEAKQASSFAKLTPRKRTGDPDPDELLEQGLLPENTAEEGGDEEEVDDEDEEEDLLTDDE